MFTGIVEETGTVTSTDTGAGGMRIAVSASRLGGIPIGASIAVNGVCLTAVESGDDQIVLDLIPETLARTNLSALEVGSRVNLERPMRADGRFDGHIVQGHVDATGVVRSVVRTDDGGVVLTVDAPEQLMRYVVEKGSITIDGVSLTIASIDGSGFSVALIPHTLEVTTLGLRTEGDTVNLEADVLAKYVERLLNR